MQMNCIAKISTCTVHRCAATPMAVDCCLPAVAVLCLARQTNRQTNELKKQNKTKLNTFRNINNIIALFIVDHWSLVVCISLGEMRAFALDILVMLLCMLVVDALCVCVFAITASELCILLRWPTNFISDQNVANRRKIYYTSAMYAPVVNNA